MAGSDLHGHHTCRDICTCLVPACSGAAFEPFDWIAFRKEKLSGDSATRGLPREKKILWFLTRSVLTQSARERERESGASSFPPGKHGRAQRTRFPSIFLEKNFFFSGNTSEHSSLTQTLLERSVRKRKTEDWERKDNKDRRAGFLEALVLLLLWT